MHFESVAIDSGGDLLLHVVRERTKRVRVRGAEQTRIDALLERRRELARERESVRDPAHLVPDELGHTGDRHAIVGERFDDPRLVHRGDRAPRRVCPEQRELRLMRRRRRLNDHRHRRRPGVSPAREALEAVNDFQVATIGADYTDRQICQLVAEHRWRRRTLAQGLERRAEFVDGDAPYLYWRAHRYEVRILAIRPSSGSSASSGRARPGPSDGSDSTWWKPSAAVGRNGV